MHSVENEQTNNKIILTVYSYQVSNKTEILCRSQCLSTDMHIFHLAAVRWGNADNLVCLWSRFSLHCMVYDDSTRIVLLGLSAHCNLSQELFTSGVISSAAAVPYVDQHERTGQRADRARLHCHCSTACYLISNTARNANICN